MQILEFFKSVESFIILGIGVLLWVIRNEILKFKLETAEYRVKEASKQAVIETNLSNHIKNDEQYQERIEESLNHLHTKIDNIPQSRRVH